MRLIMKYFVIALLFFSIFSISAVSAEENATFGQNEENIVSTETKSASSDNNWKIKIQNDQSFLNNVEDIKISSNSTTFLDIQQKIDASFDGDTIYLNGNHYSGEGVEIQLNKSLTIIGGSNDDDVSYATLDGQGLSRIMTISANDVVIKGVKFINGLSSQGGAIYLTGDDVTVNNSTFFNNSAQDSGAIYSLGKLNIENSNFINNYAEEVGAVRLYASNSTVYNSSFIKNKASYCGAIGIYGDYSNIVGSVFNSNYGGYAGGAMWAWAEYINLINSTFINNSAENISGAVVWASSKGKLDHNVFIGNSALMAGAVVIVEEDTVVKNSKFLNNHANAVGGALYSSALNVTVDNNEFHNNSADFAGAIMSHGENAFIINNIFTDNLANIAGSVIWIDSSNQTFLDNVIDNPFNLPALYVTNDTDFNYNNVDDDQIAFSSFIVEIVGIIGQVKTTHNLTVIVSDTLGNKLLGSVLADVSNHSIYYWWDDDGDLVDGKITFNMLAPDEPAILDLEIDYLNRVYPFQLLILNITQMNNDTVKFDFPSNSKGNVTLTIGNKIFAGNIVNDTAIVDIHGIPNGQYLATFKYDEFIDNITVFVKNSPISISVDAQNTMGIVGETIPVSVNVFDEFGNPIDGQIVQCSSSEINYTETGVLVNGNVIFNLPSQDSVKSLDLIISCANITKQIEAYVADVKQINNTLMVNLPAEGYFRLSFDMKEYLSHNISSGCEFVDFDDLDAGVYDAILTIYLGNSTSSILNRNLSIEVAHPVTEPTPFSVEAENIIGFVGETIIVPVSVFDEFGNPIDGQIVNCRCSEINYNANASLVNGNAIFNLPSQDSVKSLDLIISCANITKQIKVAVGDIKQAGNALMVSLPSDVAGEVRLIFDMKTYSANLSDGHATIDFDDLASGKYLANLIYSGDLKYSNFTRNLSVEVTHPIIVPVYKINGNRDVTVVYSSKATYKVLITKDALAVAGESVTFTFNGKSTVVKTDSRGYATFNINTNVKVGTYTIKATYNGIDVKNKVKITQIINAGNKKVKKSTKVTKVKISLKKVNGKYLSKKVLKIKFNMKTYKVKTNKKGAAIWKVKKSMLKKIKAGKKVKYTVTYGKATLTKKLTIKN